MPLALCLICPLKAEIPQAFAEVAPFKKGEKAMGKHGKTPVVGAIGSRQLGALCGAVVTQIGALADYIQGGNNTPAQGFISHPQTLRPHLARIFVPAVVPPIRFADWHAGWPKFWRYYLRKYDLQLVEEGLILPDYRDGFNWSVVIPAGLTPNKGFEICQSMFPSWKYADNLDLIESCREPGEKGYTVLVRDRIEADEENKNCSANNLGGKEGWRSYIAVSERCVLEARYFVETGNHLDAVNWTLCAGSRDSDGSVLRARWYLGEFGVDWCNPFDASGYLRARSVVS